MHRTVLLIFNVISGVIGVEPSGPVTFGCVTILSSCVCLFIYKVDNAFISEFFR